MTKVRIFGAITVAALLGHGVAMAHHSFAAFFDPVKIVKVTGKVTEFGFKNPHGVIVLEVPGANGQVQKWQAETNAPVVLQRRGWSRDSIKPGQTITIEGWASRDGKPYLRLRQAFYADGQPVGKLAFGQGDQ
jgi:hypothetical protein